MAEHERIWLEPSPGSDEEYGRMWCPDNVWGEDAVEYVRADVAGNEAIEIIEARLPLYTDIGQINALRECISSIRGLRSIKGGTE